jgi:hypothetical protein
MCRRNVPVFTDERHTTWVEQAPVLMRCEDWCGTTIMLTDYMTAMSLPFVTVSTFPLRTCVLAWRHPIG